MSCNMGLEETVVEFPYVVTPQHKTVFEMDPLVDARDGKIVSLYFRGP